MLDELCNTYDVIVQCVNNSSLFLFHSYLNSMPNFSTMASLSFHWI